MSWAVKRRAEAGGALGLGNSTRRDMSHMRTWSGGVQSGVKRSTGLGIRERMDDGGRKESLVAVGRPADAYLEPNIRNMAFSACRDGGTGSATVSKWGWPIIVHRGLISTYRICAVIVTCLSARFRRNSPQRHKTRSRAGQVCFLVSSVFALSVGWMIKLTRWEY